MKVLSTRLSRLAAITCTVALAVPLLLGTANAQSAQIHGVINGRSGATMTVQTQDMGNVVVVLNDFTSVEDVSGLFHSRRRQMGVTILESGLQVQVQGNYDAQNQLVANTVKFNGKNLQTATDIQAGVTPVEKQEQGQQSVKPAVTPSTVSGSGTTNYIPVWTSSTTLGNSDLYQTGGKVGIGTNKPQWALDVSGHINSGSGYLIGEMLVLTTAGPYYSANIALGIDALGSSTNPFGDTAIGYNALDFNTTGAMNTGVGTDALSTNQTGNLLTCIGFMCGPNTDGLSNATAIGAHAVVSESNALVLGGTAEYAVKVGIGTATPSNVLTIAPGAGHPVSDGWETFSSRRWKTNIQTLQDALRKIEQLRGVSYDVKASGRHEVGVIAEEVGAVVPEIVSWDQNGKDAQSVDYSRLTALLIEATKEQQQEIRQQQVELARTLRQIRQQQSLLRAQASAMRSLAAEVHETRETLRKVKAQGASAQPTLVAANQTN